MENERDQNQESREPIKYDDLDPPSTSETLQNHQHKDKERDLSKNFFSKYVSDYDPEATSDNDNGAQVSHEEKKDVQIEHRMVWDENFGMNYDTWTGLYHHSPSNLYYQFHPERKCFHWNNQTQQYMDVVEFYPQDNVLENESSDQPQNEAESQNEPQNEMIGPVWVSIEEREKIKKQTENGTIQNSNHSQKENERNEGQELLNKKDREDKKRENKEHEKI